MLSYIQTFDPYSHLLISIALGMLVGLQREWADSPAAGIRTFSFISLLGTACSIVSETFGPWFVGLGMISTLLFAGIAHFQTLKSKGEFHTSIVTGVTMLLMYIVGVMVRRDLFLPAAAMACLVAMILHIKLELHALADKFTSSELSSVMQFLLIALVILPLMPNRSFGPNDALNLHNIWLMVVFIVGISLTGYILQKLTGKRSGVISGGVIGGLISSTATTFSYSRLSSEERSSGTYHALVILIAWLVVYFRAYLEIQVVAPNIPILWPLVLMVSVSFVMVFFIWKKNIFHKEDTDITNRPIDLKTAIFFAFFYALLIAVFSYFKDDIGRTALSGVTFVAGILDIDAITLSTARLVDRKILNADQAVSYVFLALFSNTLFKGVMCLFLGKKILFDLILMPWIVSLMLQLMIIVWYW